MGVTEAEMQLVNQSLESRGLQEAASGFSECGASNRRFQSIRYFEGYHI